MRKIVWTMMMCAGLGVGAAHAQMPAKTYEGPIGARLSAQADLLITSFRTGSYVAPWANLKAGQYVNPTTGDIGGLPFGPQLW